MKFTVEPDVFEILDNLVLGVVYAKGLPNSGEIPRITKMLSESIVQSKNRMGESIVKEMGEIVLYRESFRKLGFNPNKFMCSIESLMTRVAKKGELPNISPLVDLVNAVSLKYCVPMGTHDADTFADGNFFVKLINEKDQFINAREDEKDPAQVGEIVYSSGNEIKTRRWIWRQTELGKTSENSTNILFPIDGFLENQDAVMAARDELAAILKELFHCEVKVGLIDKQNNSFTSDN